MDEVEVTVTAVLVEILEITPEAIVPTARFVEELQATSIDLVEILAVLQNTFDVEIDEAQVARLRTVQDARDLFRAAVAAKRGASCGRIQRRGSACSQPASQGPWRPRGLRRARRPTHAGRHRSPAQVDPRR